jgi:hypothetical protein
VVLTYSTSGEPERLRGARGLKYVYGCTWGTDVSQVQNFNVTTREPKGLELYLIVCLGRLRRPLGTK